ncbi:hypothetical protein M758_8G179900 [Ceratodon purpureus]|uniref:Uncharacterized protein n=1 Tax=Ceratodon purpureus TaxID=3225 RepID=A0A8T0H2E7_CERPU|nr:hypothetical protein KC19_8G184800 [Ceratodon purpureus]KAG0609379.1 hypothetical protein M758_8G179900 [Ceratodon purpureus]
MHKFILESCSIPRLSRHKQVGHVQVTKLYLNPSHYYKSLHWLPTYSGLHSTIYASSHEACEQTDKSSASHNLHKRCQAKLLVHRSATKVSRYTPTQTPH